MKMRVNVSRKKTPPAIKHLLYVSLEHPVLFLHICTFYLMHLDFVYASFLMLVIFQPSCILRRNLRAELRVHDLSATPISLKHGGGEGE